MYEVIKIKNLKDQNNNYKLWNIILYVIIRDLKVFGVICSDYF